MSRLHWRLAASLFLPPLAGAGGDAAADGMKAGPGLSPAHVNGRPAAGVSTLEAVLRSLGPTEAVAQGQGRGQGQGGGGQGEARGRDGGGARGGGADRGRPGGAAARADRPGQAGQRERGGGEGAARGRGAPGRQGGNPPARAERPRGNPGATGGGPGRSARGAEGSDARGAGTAAESRGVRSGADRGGAAVRGRGRAGGANLRRLVEELPPGARALAESPRANDRMVAGALARAGGRGTPVGELQVTRSGDRVRVLNPRGELLFDLEEDRARQLGAWELRRLGDRQPRADAPAFCRSGEGHPVWGREWCLDKGFGLGGRRDLLWSRGRIDDVLYRWPGDRDRYERPGLIDILGDVVVGRLALHALSLGLVDPLVGTFVAEPEGPRLLRIRSGDVEVAEFVDADRDERFTVLYVATPRVY